MKNRDLLYDDRMLNSEDVLVNKYECSINELNGLHFEKIIKFFNEDEKEEMKKEFPDMYKLANSCWIPFEYRVNMDKKELIHCFLKYYEDNFLLNR